MGFRDVSPTLIKIVESLLHLHSFIVRHLVLPKNVAETRTSNNDKDYEDTQMHDKIANATRKKLYTLYDPYASTYKNGYLIEELGPVQFCPMRTNHTGATTKKAQWFLELLSLIEPSCDKHVDLLVNVDNAHNEK